MKSFTQLAPLRTAAPGGDSLDIQEVRAEVVRDRPARVVAVLLEDANILRGLGDLRFFNVDQPAPAPSPETLDGSFSAVWTATIATKGSFCRDFRDLQD